MMSAAIHRAGDGDVGGLEGVHGARLARGRGAQPRVDGLHARRAPRAGAACAPLHLVRVEGRVGAP